MAGTTSPALQSKMKMKSFDLLLSCLSPHGFSRVSFLIKTTSVPSLEMFKAQLWITKCLTFPLCRGNMDNQVPVSSAFGGMVRSDHFLASCTHFSDQQHQGPHSFFDSGWAGRHCCSSRSPRYIAVPGIAWLNGYLMLAEMCVSDTPWPLTFLFSHVPVPALWPLSLGGRRSVTLLTEVPWCPHV